MEKINLPEILKSAREFDCKDLLHNYFMKHGYLFWSWGASMYTIVDSKCLKFAVKGRNHKGHVYVVLNGLDLFDVYLTSTHGNIKKTLNDLYIDQLFNAMDSNIEKLPAYKI